MMTYIEPLLGGIILGFSALLLLFVNGRIAGISGIVSQSFSFGTGSAWRWMFILGLIIGPFLLRDTKFTLPVIDSAWWMIITGGLLVGFGSVYGSGCTSGHGICGIGRMSKRSIFSVIVFMATAAVTVFIIRHVIGGY
jgi:uncharacterized membrane protein YedE/YeeE